MPLPILPILESLATDALVRAGRALLTKMPWAKDAAKAEAVEARIRRLASDATQLGRNLTEEAIEPQITRLLEQFQKELPALGMTPQQAAELAEVEREQIQVTVVEVAKERQQMRKWLQDLEDRSAQAERTLSQTDETIKKVNALEAKVARLQTLLAVALTLAIVATLLSVLFFTRR